MLDPCVVTPENRATAALYTYTPWVGAYGITCGTAMWGGSSLVARLLQSYKTAFVSDPSVDAADGGADATSSDSSNAAEDADAAAASDADGGPGADLGDTGSDAVVNPAEAGPY